MPLLVGNCQVLFVASQGAHMRFLVSTTLISSSTNPQLPRSRANQILITLLY